MKVVITLALILTPQLVLAAGGHDGEGVPGFVKYQVINLIILFGILVYFTKDSVIQFFGERKAQYLEAAKKSAEARNKAEQEFADVKSKLASLEKTKDETIHRAQTQAAELKVQMMADATQVVQRIKDEAALTVRLEVERAQRELRQQLLKDSVEAARIVLTKDVSNSDQEKLQKEFINNVGV